MLERLKKFQSMRGQFLSNRELTAHLLNDKNMRAEINLLSKHYFNKSVSGCNNCYADAYIMLMNLKIENIKEKATCRFELKRGVLLRDVVKNDISLNMTQFNISDKLALYHLRTNPKCAEKFSILPEGWQEEVERINAAKEAAKVKPKTEKTKGAAAKVNPE